MYQLLIFKFGRHLCKGSIGMSFGAKQQWWPCGEVLMYGEVFLSNNHSHSHMLLIPIEKLINERDSFRKAREAHLIEKAQTTEPLGINKRSWRIILRSRYLLYCVSTAYIFALFYQSCNSLIDLHKYFKSILTERCARLIIHGFCKGLKPQLHSYTL